MPGPAADRPDARRPGDEPKWARQTDNGRYYIDPLDEAQVPSCTNVISQWAKPALVPAAVKVTAEYMLDHLPAACRAALDPKAREAFLKGAKAVYREVWDERRDLGSRVHAHAEAENLGVAMPPDEQVAPFIHAYRAWLADFAVNILSDVEAAEITVYGRGTPRYGATSDIWVYLEFPSVISRPDPRFKGRRPYEIQTPSGLWLVDIKTSLTKPASAVYGDQVLQLAGCRFADVGLLPDDTEIEVPEFVGAAVLNLRTNGYGFIPLPATRGAFSVFRRLIGVTRWAHDLHLTPCKPVAAPYPTDRIGPTAAQKKGAA